MQDKSRNQNEHEERRHETRFQSRGLAVVMTGDRRVFSTQLIDISGSGIGLQLHSASVVSEGDVIEVRVRQNRVKARVQRCTQQNDDSVVVGLVVIEGDSELLR